MSRKLSLVSAGKLYDIDILDRIARGVAKEFNSLFSEIDVERGYENFEPCLNKEGYLPFYLLKWQLSKYIKTEPTKTRDIVLCICSYPIPGGGFGSEEGVAYVSTYESYLSDTLPSTSIFAERCVKISIHELGHVFGLQHHYRTFRRTSNVQACVMDAPPFGTSRSEEMSKYLEIMENKFCCFCNEKLQTLSVL